jgi:hypothetical protein
MCSTPILGGWTPTVRCSPLEGVAELRGGRTWVRSSRVLCGPQGSHCPRNQNLAIVRSGPFRLIFFLGGVLMKAPRLLILASVKTTFLVAFTGTATANRGNDAGTVRLIDDCDRGRSTQRSAKTRASGTATRPSRSSVRRLRKAETNTGGTTRSRRRSGRGTDCTWSTTVASSTPSRRWTASRTARRASRRTLPAGSQGR